MPARARDTQGRAGTVASRSEDGSDQPRCLEQVIGGYLSQNVVPMASSTRWIPLHFGDTKCGIESFLHDSWAVLTDRSEILWRGTQLPGRLGDRDADETPRISYLVVFEVSPPRASKTS